MAGERGMSAHVQLDLHDQQVDAPAHTRMATLELPAHKRVHWPATHTSQAAHTCTPAHCSSSLVPLWPPLPAAKPQTLRTIALSNPSEFWRATLDGLLW